MKINKALLALCSISLIGASSLVSINLNENFSSASSISNVAEDAQVVFSDWTFVDGQFQFKGQSFDAKLIPINQTEILAPICLRGNAIDGYSIANVGEIRGSCFSNQPYILDLRNINGISKSKINGLIYNRISSVPEIFSEDQNIQELIFDDEYTNFTYFDSKFGGYSVNSNIKKVVLPNSIIDLKTSFQTNNTLEYFNFPNSLMNSENNPAYTPNTNMFVGCTNPNLHIDIGYRDGSPDVFEFNANGLGDLGDIRDVFYFHSYAQYNKLNQQVNAGLAPGWQSYWSYVVFDGAIPPTPDNIQIVGPSKVNGIQWRNGSQQYSCQAYPQDADRSVEWSLSNEPLGISITTEGILKWNNMMGLGDHSFTINAVSLLDSNIRDTLNVTLTITPENTDPTSVMILGQDNLTISLNEQGYSQYTATVYPTEADQRVNWSLQNQPSGISINQNGELHWNGTTSIGTHNFVLICQTVVDSSIRDTKNISLTVNQNVVNPATINVSGASNLQGVQNQYGSSQYYASVLPVGAQQSVVWSLENTSNPNLTINTNTGLLNWNNLSASTYTFNVKATSTIDNSVSGIKPVTLVIRLPLNPQSITINGQNSLQGFTGQKGQQQYQAVVHPSEANQSVTWSLTNSISGFTIDHITGLLQWSDQLPIGTYTIVIQATSNALTSVSTNKIVTLEIIEKPKAQSVSWYYWLFIPLAIIIIVTIITVIAILAKRANNKTEED